MSAAAAATLLIGPEPGFSEEELELARSRGVAVATFGPVVLRTETAAIVAAALDAAGDGVPGVTTFATEFLGCKVSLADAQAVRERLIGDGHAEADRPPIRVVNTCCVTAEAVAKSRKAVRRAARSAERVFVTGCAANLRRRVRRSPRTSTVVAARSEPSRRRRRAGRLRSAAPVPRPRSRALARM